MASMAYSHVNADNKNASDAHMLEGKGVAVDDRAEA